MKILNLALAIAGPTSLEKLSDEIELRTIEAANYKILEIENNFVSQMMTRQAFSVSMAKVDSDLKEFIRELDHGIEKDESAFLAWEAKEMREKGIILSQCRDLMDDEDGFCDYLEKEKVGGLERVGEGGGPVEEDEATGSLETSLVSGGGGGDGKDTTL